ncbi:hypothetical protein [Evansella cellulosilytica]|uniref:hypothetical protein n=1 Tax=Evansella cellulosilytica TaxID=1413 RepID=UPI0001C27FC2|nr:hypothetical protein [Evansella cellulosilytica]
MKNAALSIADVVLNIKNSDEEVDDYEELVEKIDIEDVEGDYFPSKDEFFMSFTIKVVDGKAFIKNDYGYEPLVHVAGNHFKIEHLNLNLFLNRESGLLRTKDKHVPLAKIQPFKPINCEKFIGQYESKEIDTSYDIINRDGVLYLSHSRHDEQVLYQLNKNKFVTNAPFTFVVEFIYEGDHVTGFSFSGGRVKNLKLTKANVN